MKKNKPITPSKRHHIDISRDDLSKEKPLKSLVSYKKRQKGRSQGRITVRHKGGGSKKLYRHVCFGEENLGLEGKIERIEYDPFRSAFIALVCYQNGKRSYILMPQSLKPGDKIICDEKTPIKIGNRLKLKNIPNATQVYNIEITPLKGGKIARSAGSYAEVTGQEGKYTYIKMPSGEIRKILNECYASIGNLSNPEHSLIQLGKAGRTRHLGVRPTVRGSAMNPPDHPYGGGRGKSPRGTKRPKDI